MPRLTTFYNHFNKALEAVADHIKEIPAGIDWDLHNELLDKINFYWTTEDDVRWDDFQAAVGAWKMFWWKTKGQNA